MDSSKFIVSIPFEVGDIICPQGYLNKYSVLDIITIHYAKTKEVDVILQLKDMEFNTVGYYRYSEFNWNVVISDEQTKE